ncbi:hypothetical protein VTK56DRAFT_2682 [Thermocarpiscus australiensis]
MSALQRTLAKRKAMHALADQDSDDYSWQRERWEQARRDLAAGTFKSPDIRVPVILNPEGPISSAKELQQLAELESVPETLETIVIREDGISTARPVTICHVGLLEHKKIEEKANVVHDYTGRILILFQGKERYPTVIQSLKEGITLQGEAGNDIKDRSDGNVDEEGASGLNGPEASAPGTKV